MMFAGYLIWSGTFYFIDLKLVSAIFRTGKNFNFVTGRDDSVTVIIGYVVGGADAGVIFDDSVTSISHPVWAAIFMMELLVRAKLVTEYIGIGVEILLVVLSFVGIFDIDDYFPVVGGGSLLHLGIVLGAYRF